MYLEHLKVTGLKLLRDLDLAFRAPDGRLRKWTVLIGGNGTGKTSVLQAIALASIGKRQVNDVAGAGRPHLQDRRRGAPPLDVEARFSFSDLAFEHAVFPGVTRPPKALRLHSHVTMGSSLLDAESSYLGVEYDRKKLPDPLDAARDQQLKLWFVAGYGPGRHLPLETEPQPDLASPQLARLRPLFDPTAPSMSTAFTDHFGRTNGGSAVKARRYAKLLDQVLFQDPNVLPTIEKIELSGKHGVRRTKALQETPRFAQKIGRSVEKIPAVALAHGHQSTIAWIADLIGHVTLEAETAIEPGDMRGLVLIDELDLYLHPTWQVRFIAALKHTFPNLQFVVTTHSPLVLASLDPHEDQIVRLDADTKTGNVKDERIAGDPRVLTAAELLRLYFDLDDLHPDPAGSMLRDYRYLASNPYRSDQDDAHLTEWRKALAKLGIDPHYDPVEKREFRRGVA